jgi:hypothetical protein
MARLLAALAFLALVSPDASAQTRYSPMLTVGFGTVPEDYSNRHGSVAGSLALFRRLGPVVDLGLEVGYQRFGSGTEHYTVGGCPVLPRGACVGEVTGSTHEGGDLWYVGPTLRLHTLRNRPVRLFALVGLGHYASTERTKVVYRDDRGEVVPDPQRFEYGSTFKGIGANAGIGIEGVGFGRLRWTIVARTHGAIGGVDGEMGSLRALSLTAGVTLPWQSTGGDDPQ